VYPMAGAYMMRFMTEIEKGHANIVQQQLLSGNVHANQSYLGIYPLIFAVEQLDIDIAVLLLTAGADVTLKPKDLGKHGRNALELATEMRDDPKGKDREKAAEIVKVLSDKKACEQHFEELQDRMEAKRQRDKKRALIFLALVLPVFAAFFFLKYIAK